jgi:hypothetical protein
MPLRIEEYRQPWPILGIEWPAEMNGIANPSLTLVWHATPGTLILFTSCRSEKEFVHSFFMGQGTLDSQIDDNEMHGLDELESVTTRTIARMSLNLGLLLTHKAHRVLRLPDEIHRKRKHRDRATRLDAHQRAQPVLFRELDMLLKWQQKTVQVSDPTGLRLAPHFRRGHWKRVAHGPRHSLHRLDWIEPYWTGGGLGDGQESPVTLLR